MGKMIYTITKSSAKRWADEETFMMLKAVQDRDLLEVYGGKLHLPEKSKGTAKLTQDLNDKFGKDRSVAAVSARFYEFQKQFGWPECIDLVGGAIAIESYQKEHDDVKEQSDDGLMLIDVNAFHHHVMHGNHDYNSALLASRVD